MDSFELVAELGLALAGFTGIFLVLTQRRSSFSLLEGISVRMVVLNSFFAAFLALVPLTISYFEILKPHIWQLSSAAYLLSVVPFFIYIEKLLREIPSGEKPAHMSIQNFVGRYSTILIALAQVLNIAGWPFSPGPGLFFLGLVVALGLAAMVFAGFLFDRILLNDV